MVPWIFPMWAPNPPIITVINTLWSVWLTVWLQKHTGFSDNYKTSEDSPYLWWAWLLPMIMYEYFPWWGIFSWQIWFGFETTIYITKSVRLRRDMYHKGSEIMVSECVKKVPMVNLPRTHTIAAQGVVAIVSLCVLQIKNIQWKKG